VGSPLKARTTGSLQHSSPYHSRSGDSAVRLYRPRGRPHTPYTDTQRRAHTIVFMSPPHCTRRPHIKVCHVTVPPLPLSLPTTRCIRTAIATTSDISRLAVVPSSHAPRLRENGSQVSVHDCSLYQGKIETWGPIECRHRPTYSCSGRACQRSNVRRAQSIGALLRELDILHI